MRAKTAFITGFVGTTAFCAPVLMWQLGGTFFASPVSQIVSSHSEGTAKTVSDVNRDLRSGHLRLAADGATGYLKAVLTAFDIPLQSQLLVYSETSLQSTHISPKNPRALYFNDTVAVGWVNGAETLELAALDTTEGVVFYTFDQRPAAAPQFTRQAQRCLVCHHTPSTSGTTGLLAMSMLPLADNAHEYAQGWPVDQRTPIHDRWGGWYVTGQRVPSVHLGNVPVHHAKQSYVRMPVAPVLPALSDDFIQHYLSPYSDVVAHLVFEHQVGATNLLARLHTASRGASTQDNASEMNLNGTVNDLVDYLLFIDEAPLPGVIRGSSGFAEAFAARGPRDRRGRSLRELDLRTRLLRYRCSYMIYTPAFDALPGPVSEAVHARLWEVLSGTDHDPAYSSLSSADRRAIVEILLETKDRLPDYFRPSEVR